MTTSASPHHAIQLQSLATTEERQPSRDTAILTKTWYEETKDVRGALRSFLG